MFSFNPYSFRRMARCVFVPIILSLVLFAGCKVDEPEESGGGLNPALIGTWEFTGEFGTDGYTINTAKLTYYDDYGFGYAGTIKYVSNFTNTAGVIIIEYDPGHEASYTDWNTFEPLPLKGTFIGIYYKELKPGVSVQIGGAIDDAYTGAEEKTLDAAIAAFTMGNEGNYMTYYGTYLKQ